jgi:hypothetical protein
VTHAHFASAFLGVLISFQTSEWSRSSQIGQSWWMQSQGRMDAMRHLEMVLHFSERSIVENQDLKQFQLEGESLRDPQLPNRICEVFHRLNLYRHIFALSSPMARIDTGSECEGPCALKTRILTNLGYFSSVFLPEGNGSSCSQNCWLF